MNIIGPVSSAWNSLLFGRPARYLVTILTELSRFPWFMRTMKIKLSIFFIKHQAMMTYKGMEVQLHLFLTLSLDGDE
jgi:hypothetical protein